MEALGSLKRSRSGQTKRSEARDSSLAVLRLALGIASFLAALAVFTSLWHVCPPLSLPLMLWIQHLLPIVSDVSLTSAQRIGSTTPVLHILVSVIYAVPFAGLWVLRRNVPSRIRRVSLAVGTLILVGTILGLPGDGEGIGQTPWAAGLCALGTGALGAALLVLGRRGGGGAAWAAHGSIGEVLSWLLTVAGIAVATLVLLPLGLLLLGGAYVALGICLVCRVGHVSGSTIGSCGDGRAPVGE